jgi:hypothetical protein
MALPTSTGHAAVDLNAMPIPTELFATLTGRLTPGDRPGIAMDAIVVWRALFMKFGPLIGPVTTELLFVRSLRANASTFPWLPHSLADTSRPVLEEFERRLDILTPEEIVTVNRALLATYTTFLSDLIGSGLTVRFLQTAFPDDATDNKIQE